MVDSIQLPVASFQLATHEEDFPPRELETGNWKLATVYR
jgi:hypothetical protein